MITSAFTVEDMHCASCSDKITAALDSLGSVRDVVVNPVNRRVFVTHEEALQSHNILNRIRALGFHPNLTDVQADREQNTDTLSLKRLGVAGICTMQVMMIHIALYAGAFDGMDPAIERLLGYAALIFTIPVFSFAAVPFFRTGFGDLPRRGINMDTPIALAITIAFAASLFSTLTGSGDVYYDSVTMFTFLMLGARVIDERLRKKLELQDSLLDALPRFTERQMSNGDWATVPLDQLTPGDRARIRQGDRFPADGILCSTAGLVDESLLTGEVEPRQAAYGDPIWAGTINQGPSVEIEVRAVGAGNRLAQIDRQAAVGAAGKGRMSRIADSVARYFIPGILFIAASTFLYWAFAASGPQPFEAALAVLVVSCPCALSLATPATLTAAMSGLRQRGVLVRAPAALERLTGVARALFDKTGTLTTPTPELIGSKGLNGFEVEHCLSIAAALQRHSSHPLAAAFAPFDDGRIVAEAVDLRVGAGVQATVHGQPIRIGSADFAGFSAADASGASTKSVYLSIGALPAAVFQISNPLRRDASYMLAQLADRHVLSSIISGDTEAQTSEIADQLGIDAIPRTSPEQKATLVAAEPVLFVGDGLNDLPAMTNASVSVATLETVDLVKSKADIVLLTDRLESLVSLVDAAGKARRIMRQNLCWAIGYNVLAIPLAVMGLLTPWIAALGMSLSSLLVIANACRAAKA